MSKGTGTPGFMAPEAVYYEDHRDLLYPYSSASDVYAVGKIMMCLIKLENERDAPQPLYDGTDIDQRFDNDMEEVYDRALLDCVLDCLEPDPRNRPPVEKLWTYIQREVMKAPGLRALPPKLRGLEEGDVLRFEPDRYAVWAG
ncbi:hypothetical protein LTR37_011284 [Vermiconidia calcicola]|uniref:Uncharacterized protein n=1 Tax=Vermiconidia calcicola TaxID=1690605 RepID=A0ACC3N2F2_9PEZI|nr:hypothetical protein LTR37_011284 [Vermiconidia calcicola]